MTLPADAWSATDSGGDPWVTSASVITLEKVSKRYGRDAVAVDDLSFTVEEGELCVLVGPSGCGKTTTLRMINRLIEPTSGRILIGGTDVLAMNPVLLRRGVGYVIQQGGLFPHRRVSDNVATVPRLLGWDKARVDARVAELLELVGLDPSRYRAPLSARALGGRAPTRSGWRGPSGPTHRSS